VSKRNQRIIAVSYRCSDCGCLFGDPEQKDFPLWIAETVNHWITKHRLDVRMGYKEGQNLNQLVSPVYVWV